MFFPTTEEAFDRLIHKLVVKYKLPNEEHAAVVVANRIMHLPPDQATATLDYLGHCVLKNIAYQVAQTKAQKISHKMQIDQLISNLTANINDQQSRDALQMAASQGSEYAHECLGQLNGPCGQTL